MAQTITVPEVIAACRAALANGTLALLNDAAEDCRYFYDEIPDVGCAIGVAMNDETLSKLRECGWESLTLLDVVNVGAVDCAKNDLVILATIQDFHDSLVSGTGLYPNDFTTDEIRQAIEVEHDRAKAFSLFLDSVEASLTTKED